jgi:alkylation response protein AidB-like acyl-CoA dehydrogenase
MIDFELGDELELVQETARGFADDHLRRQLRDHEAARAVSADASAAFDEIGLAGLEVPESLGGSGLGALARIVVMEELGAADPGAALALDRLGPALYALAELGGSDALERFGRPVLDAPGARAALVWTGEGTRTRIVAAGDALDGVVPWVASERVDLAVLLDEAGCTVVEAGMRVEPLRGAGLRAAGAGELHLEHAPVAARFDGIPGAELALARARVYVAALILGVMRESAEFSRHYALERVAFGKPIAHHQALAFLITDMATSVDSARVLLQEAAWRLDDALPSGLASPAEVAEAAATAFSEAVEQAMSVTPNGVQILGGHGFMQDYPVEKMMREARALSLLLGGVDLAREHAGRHLAGLSGNVSLSLEALG